MNACIFDLDGTLLDSMYVWKTVDINFFEKRGLVYTEDYARAISGMCFEETAAYTIERYRLKESAEEIIREWMDAASFEYANRVELKPFAREFLAELKRSGVPFAAATTSSKELYVPALKNNGIYEWFSYFADSEELRCGKDRPDIFLRAADRLGVKPSECLVFEDTLTGLVTAKKSGFMTAAVIDRSCENFDEISEIADIVSEDFEIFVSQKAEIF